MARAGRIETQGAVDGLLAGISIRVLRKLIVSYMLISLATHIHPARKPLLNHRRGR